MLKGSFFAIGSVSLLVLILISTLAGVVASLSVYLIKRKFSSGIVGGSGVLFSVVAPTCPSCSIGLLSMLGIGGFLSVLPFKGLELGFLSVILLLISVVFLSKKIVTKTCSV